MRIISIIKPKYTKYDVIYALDKVANSKSLRKASLEWGVPRSTLQDRNTITQSRQDGASHLQRLPTVVENRLTNWILNQEALGYRVTHAQIRTFSKRLLALQGDHKLLRKH